MGESLFKLAHGLCGQISEVIRAITLQNGPHMVGCRHGPRSLGPTLGAGARLSAGAPVHGEVIRAIMLGCSLYLMHVEVIRAIMLGCSLYLLHGLRTAGSSCCRNQPMDRFAARVVSVHSYWKSAPPPGARAVFEGRGGGRSWAR